jgi:hypothetical protein
MPSLVETSFFYLEANKEWIFEIGFKGNDV